MNVKELKEAIKVLPDDMEVILQSDGEGNNYSPLYCYDSEAIYIARASWWGGGEVYDSNWSAQDAGFEKNEWEELKSKTPRCLVLAPMN